MIAAALVILRASTLDVVNVPNAKYLAHLPHRTPKTIFIRYSKCHNFCNIWTVLLHIYHCTDENGILINIFFILFSLSPLFSLFFSLLSHLCSLSPILFSLTFVITDPSSSISHRLHFASSSPISPGIVIIIVIANQNRRGHRRWGEIGVFVMIVGIDVEILIVGIDIEVRWDLDRGSPVLVGLSWSECFWVWVDRGVFWVWVDRGASGHRRWVDQDLDRGLRWGEILIWMFSGFELLC